MSQHFKKYEAEALKTLNQLEEYAHLTLPTKKKIIKLVWRNLNEHVGKMRGGSAQPKNQAGTYIDPNVQTMIDATKLASDGLAAWNLGSKLIPFII